MDLFVVCTQFYRLLPSQNSIEKLWFSNCNGKAMHDVSGFNESKKKVPGLYYSPVRPTNECDQHRKLAWKATNSNRLGTMFY